MLATPKKYIDLLKFINNPENLISKEKITLGKKLFFDKQLSKGELPLAKELEAS